MKLLALLLMACSLWAGQSLNGGTLVTAAVPVYSTASSFTAEFFAHSLNMATAFGRHFQPKSLGVNMIITGNTFQAQAFNTNATGFSEGSMGTIFPDGAIAVRFTKDVSTSTLRLEMWDQNGIRKINSTRTYTTQDSSATAETNFRDDSSLGGLAFARIKNYAVAANSRPPTTFDSDPGIIYEWKFDGTPTASVGGVNATGSGIGYTNPSLFQNAYANAQANPLEWASVTSLRAGRSQTLTSNSYTQADNTNEVTCSWNQIAGPSLSVIANPTDCDAEVSGTIFGEYQYRLVVADIDGNTASTVMTVGAVATDSNGVVIHANPLADKLFGPMIAFGKNPWGYADEANRRGLDLRWANYQTNWPRDWLNYFSGTVDYNLDTTNQKGTISATISASDTAISLTGGHNISLTTMPTIIAFGLIGFGGEEVLICSAAGLNLTVCPGGRGWGRTTASAHNAGDGVFQNKVTGTGTTFLTDFCPAGAVSFQGTIKATAGTVTLTAGSASVPGSGTGWSSPTVVGGEGQWIRVSATYSGGTPFVFLSPIASINYGTQTITLRNPFPSAGDTGSYSYTITQSPDTQFSPQYVRTDTSVGQTFYSPSLCTSDTVMYFGGGSAGPAIYGAQTGQQYSKYTQNWYTTNGNGSINFYDEALANYSLYFRSGLSLARTAARWISDGYFTNPQIDNGFTSQFPRNIAATGAFAGAVLDNMPEMWDPLNRKGGFRKLATSGAAASSNPCTDELRENAYIMSWLGLAAAFDPDPTNKTNWQSLLPAAYTRDASCAGAGGSYSTIWGSSNPLTLTTGSRDVTGTGFDSAVCARTAAGTATATNGVGSITLLTGTPIAGPRICMTGTRAGAGYMTCMEFSGTSGTINLAGKWIGDSGTINWQTESDGASLNVADANVPGAGIYVAQHSCEYISPTQIRLDRNWAGATTSAGNLYRSVGLGLGGYGVQPFMLGGIKTMQMDFAAKGATGSTATDYATLRDSGAAWFMANGFDPANGGLYYGRGYAQCEPLYTQGLAFFDSIVPACSYGDFSYTSARGLMAEGQRALSFWYLANPTAPNKATGDQFYANQWGYKWTTGGVTSQSVWDNDFATNNSLDAGKWYGFQFGIGAAHQWPAARLGGVAPADTRTVTLSYTAPATTSATSATYVAPSGASTTISCSAGSCSLPTDWRQGNYLYRLTHTVTGGQAVSDLMPLKVQ